MLNDMKTSIFGVFINGFRGVRKVRVRTIPAFSFDLKLLLTIYLMKISYLLIF
jgi:hypothetical protein